MVRKVIDISGNIRYYNEQGKFHREDGPAIIYKFGYKAWRIDGRYHRIGGPAIEWSNGDKYYLVNGVRHREDGPAVECIDGYKGYWLIGKLLSYEDWLAIKDYPLLW